MNINDFIAAVNPILGILLMIIGAGLAYIFAAFLGWVVERLLKVLRIAP